VARFADEELAALVSQQFGVFRVDQAVTLGFTTSAMRTRRSGGRWVRVQPRVCRFAGVVLSWDAELLAACLSAHGTASHRSAAYLWRLDGSRAQRPEIVVPRGCRPRLDRVVVHHSKDFDRRDECWFGPIPATGLLRTVLDLGAVLQERRVAQSVDDVLRTGRSDLADLWETYTRHRRRGRNGTGVLNRVLEEAARQRGVPESFFERVAYDLIVDSGLPQPVRQHEVRDGGNRFVARIDLAYPDRRIAIELLGKEFHHTEEAFERDPARRNKLELLHWIVLEFTWRQYVDDPSTIIRQVADALRRTHLVT
jgi:hypothetical protein